MSIVWNPTQATELDRHESFSFLRGLAFGILVSAPLWLLLLRDVLR